MRFTLARSIHSNDEIALCNIFSYMKVFLNILVFILISFSLKKLSASIFLERITFENLRRLPESYPFGCVSNHDDSDQTLFIKSSHLL